MGRPPAKEKLNFHLKLRLRKSGRQSLEQKRAELNLPTLAEVAREALRKFGVSV
jgi:hypothetical protein